jgi:glucose/arabinose dehydrogenase
MKLNVKCFVLLAFLLAFSCRKDPDPSKRAVQISVLLSNLELPWGMVFLPNGDLIFTERAGRISLLKKGETQQTVLMRRIVSDNKSEGGLLGITLDPNFSSNHYIFIYETADSNRVVRLVFNNNTLSEDRIIVKGIPRGVSHDGGALRFGPDGYLYIGTGDATQSQLAQGKNSLAGKILKVDRNGDAAPGNPFGTRVYTYGHRNVQGFDWTPNGRMLSTEHGPTTEFGWCCHDEINLIIPGKNYGWPLALGGTETDSLTPPLVQSGFDTWAPSGCFYLRNSAFSGWSNCLVAAALKGQSIMRFYFDDNSGKITSYTDTLKGIYSRIRNFIQAPDGSFLFCTSNYPATEGDKIYQMSLK